MKNKILHFVLFALAAIAAVVLFNCAVQNPSAPDNGMGSIAPRVLFRGAAGNSIDFDETVKLSLKVVHFDLTVNGAVRGVDFPYQSHEGQIDNVAAGNHQLVFTALDSAGTAVFTGTSYVTVEAGKIAAPAVTAGPARADRPYLHKLKKLTATSVNLEWTIWDNGILTGVTQVKVLRKIDNGTFIEIQNLVAADRNWTDMNAGAAVQQTLTYKLHYVRGSGDFFTNEQSILMPAGGGTDTASLSPSLNTPVFNVNKVTLNWSLSADKMLKVQKFRVYRSNDGVTFSQIAEVASGNTVYEDNSAPLNQKLHYKVAALNASNVEFDSPVKTVTTSTGPIDPPYTGTRAAIDTKLSATGNQVYHAYLNRIITVDPTKLIQVTMPDSDKAWITKGSGPDTLSYLFQGQPVNANNLGFKDTLGVQYPVVIDYMVGGAVNCPSDMVAVSGYCIDRNEVKTSGSPITNVGLAAAAARCIADGKRLCDEFEWTTACSQSKSGGALASEVFDLSLGGNNEWMAVSLTDLGSGAKIGSNNGTCSAPAAGAMDIAGGRGDLGFRCCK